MPSGYSASALVAVLPTNASGQIKPCFMSGRRVSIVTASVLSTTTQATVWTALNIAGAVPINAVEVHGWIDMVSSVTTSYNTVLVSSDVNGLGTQQVVAQPVANVLAIYSGLALITAQVIYYQSQATAGTGTTQIGVTAYTF
jgi:hypothetical protein